MEGRRVFFVAHLKVGEGSSSMNSSKTKAKKKRKRKTDGAPVGMNWSHQLAFEYFRFGGIFRICSFSPCVVFFFEVCTCFFLEVLQDLSTSRSSCLKELQGNMENVVVVVVLLLLLPGSVPHNQMAPTEHRKSFLDVSSKCAFKKTLYYRC